MAVIANNAKPSKAKLVKGADEFTAAINSWRIKNTTPVDTPVDISGVARPAVGDPVCSLELNVSQDFTATGFAAWLMDNHGIAATIIVQDANATWTCQVIAVMPPSIGGDYGKIARETISLPMVGKPARSAAV